MDTVRTVLATHLKRLRKSRGLNQAALAEAVGCEVNTISRYENGANTPTIDHVLKLAEALGVHPMELLPPPSSVTQRLYILRQELAAKALQVDSPERLEEAIQLLEAPLPSHSRPKK